MAQYQAGMLVAYGKLGVHEIETVGLQSFCGKPAKIIIPFVLILRIPTTTAISHGKRRCSAPGAPAQQAEADLARIKAEKLPIPAGVQTALAEHYQALLHTNDFYQYLTLFKELGQKQTQQQSRGRKINAMDTYFYQMVERVLREELAVAFGESQQEAGRRLLEILR